MTKFNALLTFVFVLSSASISYADYTCDDRALLQEIVTRLNATCGSGICQAKGYKGSTVTRAIAACTKVGWSESACHSDATCADGISMCNTRGYKGDSLEDAIGACIRVGWAESQCHNDVTCTSNVRICSAKGYKGSTLEAAIAACVKVGWAVSVCHNDVTCR